MLAARDANVNSLWLLNAIDTSAVRNVLGGQRAIATSCRSKPDVGDLMPNRPGRDFSERFLFDEEIPRNERITDFRAHADHPSLPLVEDSCVRDEILSQLPVKPPSLRLPLHRMTLLLTIAAHSR